MKNIDTDKIIKMTNDKIGYDLFQKEEKIRMNKFKKGMFALAICLTCIIGTLTVDATTDGAISDGIKNIVNIKINGEEKNATCQKKEDGSITCTFEKSVTGENTKTQVEFSAPDSNDTNIDSNENK